MIRATSGRARVTIRGPIAEPGPTRGATGELAPKVTAIAEAFVAEARRTWPVASGASRDALAAHVTHNDHAVAAVITSTDYALEIESTKTGDRRSAQVARRAPAAELAARVSATRGNWARSLVDGLNAIIKQRLRHG
jgi:hypothetical protein